MKYCFYEVLRHCHFNWRWLLEVVPRKCLGKPKNNNYLKAVGGEGGKGGWREGGGRGGGGRGGGKGGGGRGEDIEYNELRNFPKQEN